MPGSIVLTVIAVVLSVGDGSLTVGGEALELLRPGDRGEIYYELTIGPGARRIEVGSGELISLADGRAVLRPDTEAGRVQSGYAVAFTVPYERLAPASVETGEPLDERLTALRSELATAHDRAGELEAELAAARAALSRELATPSQSSSPSAGARGILVQLEQRVETLERRNAELELEVEALRFILGKTLAESAD